LRAGVPVAFKWETVQVRTEHDECVKAVVPVVVSASRRTDIPAFYAEWFVRRLQAGHLSWANPFNGTHQYVSFARTRVIVFWTKNPQPLLPHLDTLDRRGIGYYFHFTLNDYEAEGLEPNVPALAARIRSMRKLAGRIGKEKIVWRFDPALATREINVDRLTDRLARIGDALHGCTEKLVFAFADIDRYAKVHQRLQRTGADCRELRPEEMREFAEHVAGLVRSWGMTAAACAESIDLSDLGIAKSKCVDDELLLRLFPHDEALVRFLGPVENRRRLKDQGQRKECGCIISKDIGTYDTCPHFCRYCYANGSERTVRSTLARHSLATG
jgi:hypothetical protein